MNKKLLGSLFTSTCIHIVLFISIGTFCNLFHKINYANKTGTSSIKSTLRVSTKTEFLKNKSRNKKVSVKSKSQSLNPTSTPQKSSQGKTDQGQKEIIAQYLSTVRELIAQNKVKNRVASRLKLTGTVGLSFSIKWPNDILDLNIISPSKHSSLNHSALQSIQRIKQFPTLPKELKTTSIPVSMNIIYN